MMFVQLNKQEVEVGLKLGQRVNDVLKAAKVHYGIVYTVLLELLCQGSKKYNVPEKVLIKATSEYITDFYKYQRGRSFN